jgi:NPCBM/NEW2 domain/Bacterial Ig domain
MSAVYIQDGAAISIVQNRFTNVIGPVPRGQFVQFNRVNGAGSRISCNVGENIYGQATPEDALNLYDSNGTASSPIIVENNKIKGGGPSSYGGGIMLGDGGGSYQIARNNILADPGQYGVAIAGGNNIQVLQNRVYARQQSFTNVGIYVWNQYGAACFGHTVQGNSVNWTNSSGQKNPAWNAGNCGTVTSMDSNNWNATLTDAIFYESMSACQVGDTTPPTVSVTSPAANQIVSGTITVSADAMDGGGVAGVSFKLDGSPICGDKTAAPYSTTLNTTTVTNGDHVIEITAKDQAGNTKSSQVAIQVNNVSPLTTRYFSDLAYKAVANGWGPAEKDMSNGENGAGDGKKLTVAGVGYTKGLGVHGLSDVRYAMSGKCTSFTARVGIDDEVGSNGSSVFQVWADGAKLYESAVLTGAMGSVPVSVNVTGKTELKLIVTNVGDDWSYDHADWLNAKLVCRY